MTYEAATDQVVTLIEATAPTWTTHGLFDLAAPFRLDRDGSADRARYFTLAGLSSEVVEWTYTPGARIWEDEIEIAIHYPEAADARSLDLVMHADAAEIQARLITEALWERPTSTIERIEAVTVPIEYVSSETGRASVLRVRVRHTEQSG